MLALFGSVLSLFLSLALLLAATGLFNTFIGLRAALEGFSAQSIGLMMSAFYAGLVAGSLRCAPLINRIGHIRAFATFSSISAATVLLFTFVIHEAAWIGLRVILGFNLAGMYMVAESWLNNRATSRTRGSLLAMYMMTTYLAMGGGQFLIRLGELASLTGFLIAAVLLSLAVTPVAVTRATYPPPVENPHFGITRLFAISPLAVVACVGSGLSQGAIYGMAPVFASNLGLGTADVATFMGVLIFAGLALQFPVGRLSDRFDRRRVITAVGLGAALSSLAVVVLVEYYSSAALGPGGETFTSIWLPRGSLLLVLAAVYGGIVTTIYPLSVAYANDYLRPEELVPAAGGLVLAYSVGAAVGPLAAAWTMALIGPQGLFLFTAIVAAATAGFAVYRMRRRAWAPVVEKEAFVALPDVLATPIAGDFDPRGESATQTVRWRRFVEDWRASPGRRPAPSARDV